MWPDGLAPLLPPKQAPALKAAVRRPTEAHSIHHTAPRSGVLDTTNYIYESPNRLQEAYMMGHYQQTVNIDPHGNAVCTATPNYCKTTLTLDTTTTRINTSG